MKKFIGMLAVLLCYGIPGLPVCAAELEKGFAAPPDSAKPWVYWGWCNGNVTKEGITADLEAMKRVGIGGALHMQLTASIPAGPVKDLSAQWRDLMRHAATEAKRLNLAFSLTSSLGYTGGGGPWIKPEESMQMLTYSETHVTGGSHFSGALKRPYAWTDYYRDIAVLAFPTPTGEEHPFSAFNPKITANFEGLEGSKIIDGNEKTRCKLGSTNAASKYIQFEFPEPFTAQTLIVEFGGTIARGVISIQTSDNGNRFTTVADVAAQWNEELFCKLVRITVQFPRSTSRYYRINFQHIFPRGGGTPELAEIRLLSTPRIHYLEHKGGFVGIYPVGSDASFNADITIPAKGIVRKDIVDLSGKMSADGVLTWDVPAGQWTILRVGHASTGMKNHPAQPDATGLECDKLDPRGIEAQFSRFIDPLLAKGAPLEALFPYIHIDSWEMGCQNWTGIFRAAFKKRRGYDLLPWLPVLAGGYIIKDSESSERFLRDFRVTIAELLRDNFWGRTLELCHERGLKFEAEASGPQQYMLDPIGFQSRTDVPMGEFWTGLKYQPESDTKIAASAAHVCGYPFAAAEAFTGNDKWTAYPFSVKGLGDRAFCVGINRFVFHNYAQQPWTNNLAPGMTFAGWGMFVNRNQTWWQQSTAWMSYLAKCQHLLSRGQFVSDIVCLTGDPPAGLYRTNVRDDFNPAIPSGYDYDGISDEILQKMTVANGRLLLQSGMSYGLLLLPDSKTMTPECVRKVKNLVAAGATVVGQKPQASPSLSGYPASDAEVKTIADEVWGSDGAGDHAFGKGMIRTGTFKEIFRAMQLPPDFEYAAGKDAEINYIHRTDGDAEIYFVANANDRPEDAVCTFRVSGKAPEFWHPDTGSIEQCAVYKVDKERIQVTVHFERFGSVFVVFRSPVRSSGISEVRRDGSPLNPPTALDCRLMNGAVIAEFRQSGHYEFKAPGGAAKLYVSIPDPLLVSGPWEVSFPPNLGAPAKATFEKLISWPEHPDSGIKYFSGTATYRTTFDCPAGLLGKERRLYLDLGDVQVSAEVLLNGKNMGIRWKPPFCVDITGAVKPGANALEVGIVNLWPNRLIGDEQLPADCEYTARGALDKWPAWLTSGVPRTSGRIAFATWKHYKKGDKLLPSGLLGPVTIVAAELRSVEPSPIVPIKRP